MKNFLRISAIVFLMPLLQACWVTQALDNAGDAIDGFITKADKAVVANQAIFNKACSKGKDLHSTIVANQLAGTLVMSAKDTANELAAYDTGVNVCATTPTTLAELLAKIPDLIDWTTDMSDWLSGGKVN